MSFIARITSLSSASGFALVAMASATSLVAGCNAETLESTEASESALVPPSLKEALGYDVVQDEVRGNCVETAPFTAYAGASGQSAIYNLNLVETQEDIQSALNINAAVKIKWLTGNVDGNFNADFTKKLDMTHVYALVSAVIENPPVSVDDPRLKADALATYAANHDRFYERCGTHFVDSVTTGGLFFALVDIETSTSEEARDISASLSANYRAGLASGSGSAAVSHSLESSLTNKTVRMHVIQQGGVGETASFDGSIDQVLRRLGQFASTVATSPRIVDFTVRSYKTLGLPGDDTTEVDVRRASVNQSILADRTTQAIDALSTFEAALSRPQAFEPFDRPAVVQGSRDASANVNLLEDAARECYIDAARCALPTNLAALPPLPQRRATPAPAPAPASSTSPAFKLTLNPETLTLCHKVPQFCRTQR